jgi:hypothetical protein
MLLPVTERKLSGERKEKRDFTEPLICIANYTEIDFSESQSTTCREPVLPVMCTGAMIKVALTTRV